MGENGRGAKPEARCNRHDDNSSPGAGQVNSCSDHRDDTHLVTTVTTEAHNPRRILSSPAEYGSLVLRHHDPLAKLCKLCKFYHCASNEKKLSSFEHLEDALEIVSLSFLSKAAFRLQWGAEKRQ